MASLVDRLQVKWFPPHTHPYRIFEERIAARLTPDSVMLDAGCGRTVPLLSKYSGKAKQLVGVEIVDFDRSKIADPDIKLLQSDLAHIDMPDASVDLVVSRSVLEHLTEPGPVFQEIARILKPGGRFLFLVPNFWDYVSLISWIIPNRFHGSIVAGTEGRATLDTFPAYYRANTRGAVRKWGAKSGMSIQSFEYLGQYPAMLRFHVIPFVLGSAYEKVIASVDALGILRGWILAELVKDPA